MYQKIRQDEIVKILKKQGYVTVEFLTKELHYSTATINRDLNMLQKQQLIKRSYGGAELIEQHGVRLPFRYHQMRIEKRKIGCAAAELIQPGDTVFVDASTTSQSMAQALADIEGVTVITNNMALATYLSEHGVKVICLGGPVYEAPCMLFGNETILNAAMYRADKMFFSTGGVTHDGRICDSSYSLLFRTMAENADKVYYLADHNKIDVQTTGYLFDFSSIDGVISDYDFPKETKRKFPDTAFIKV